MHDIAADSFQSSWTAHRVSIHLTQYPLAQVQQLPKHLGRYCSHITLPNSNQTNQPAVAKHTTRPWGWFSFCGTKVYFPATADYWTSECLGAKMLLFRLFNYNLFVFNTKTQKQPWIGTLIMHTMVQICLKQTKKPGRYGSLRLEERQGFNLHAHLLKLTSK